MALEQMNQMARLVEGNWAAAWAALGDARGEPATIVENLPNMVRVYTPGFPEPLLNMVIRYTNDITVTPDDIETVIAPFRQHHLPFQWWLTRGIEPAKLRERLDAIGMETWGGATMMYLPLTDWSTRYPPAPLTVSMARVVNDDEARAALDIMCSVFSIPHEPMKRWTTLNPAFDLWLARMGARPVAAMATLLDGDTVGIYHLATLHGARRRGVAGNLLRLALIDARARGAQWSTLTATPEAQGLYELLGYRACGLMEQWMPGPRLGRELMGTRGGAIFDGHWG